MLIVVVLFTAAVKAGSTAEFALYPDRFYVFLLSDSIELSDDDPKLYDGVTFPLYAGYVIAGDGKFEFVKKTHLPVKKLVEYFNDVVEKGSVEPLQNINRPKSPRVLISDENFVRTLHSSMTTYFMGVFFIGFTGEPDENYTPEFEETCTFRVEPSHSCGSGDYSVPRDLLLIPTSNVVKERLIRHGIGRKSEIERYNPTTKKWEVVGYY